MDPYDELNAALLHERQGQVDLALERYRVTEALAGDDQWLLSEALRRQAYLHHAHSEWEISLELSLRAAAVAEAAGLNDQHAEALIAASWVDVARGSYEEAISRLERVSLLTSDLRITGLALQNLGAIAAERGNWDLARHQLMESVHRFQAAGYQRGVAFVHNNFGRGALDHRNYVLAADLLQQAVMSAKTAADPDLLAVVTMNVAEALAGAGELDQAEATAKEARGYFSSAGNGWRRVECERLLGDIEKQREHDDEARKWWSIALETARAIGALIEVGRLEERLGVSAKQPKA